MKIDLSGLSALVTGSTRGIGHIIARQLAECGAHLTIHGRTEEAVAKARTRLVADVPGAQVQGVAGDLGNAAGCHAVLSRVKDVDILVANAGIYEWKSFFEIPGEDWIRYFETHVMAGARLAQALMPGMLKRNWGRIVFIASDSGVYIPPDMVHYGVTKAAELALARGLAELTVGTGVTVNAVLPGPTHTDNSAAFFDDYAQRNGVPRDQVERVFVEKVRPTSLIRRMAQPEEVANLVTYTCSRLSSATNGAALRAEGGILRHIT